MTIRDILLGFINGHLTKDVAESLLSGRSDLSPTEVAHLLEYPREVTGGYQRHFMDSAPSHADMVGTKRLHDATVLEDLF